MSQIPTVRFEILINDYHDEIYRYLWRLLDSGKSETSIEAQDVTQDVFLRAYKSFDRLRPDSNHRAWLYKIATNCAMTILKRRKRQTPLTDADEYIFPDSQPSPAQQFALKENVAAVMTAIETLPIKQQAAVMLRHVHELDYADIALALDCSEDSARANVYQGTRRLRQQFDPSDLLE
jgi:RNA polymerase sigma-70 factor (ECF subfamily)